jgi:hypothetical protein
MMVTFILALLATLASYTRLSYPGRSRLTPTSRHDPVYGVPDARFPRIVFAGSSVSENEQLRQLAL